MCGIVGILSKNQQAPDQGLLEQMREVVTHRGPDDAGVFMSPQVALGHRRLSILDTTSAGHQPMTTPDGRFTLVFNGEIYNYRQLAQKYLAGLQLRSSSDTEVLLHLLAQQGMAVLNELRGMFAFALWDQTEQVLWLARDPFGKKPLYVQSAPIAVYFASELKSLQVVAPASIDTKSNAQYFLYEYAPSPRTIYTGISQVPLGHYAKITKTSYESTSWWQPVFLPKHTAPAPALLKQCDQLLEQAVSRRLVSDVPVGVFLSGGIDSSAIAWYMRQQVAGPLHSFSVSFHEHSFNEAPYAELAAKALHTTHHDLRFSLEQFKQAIQTVVPIMDTPLGDASLLPTAAISFLAKEYVTVVLDGDGSDELLGGYGIFPAAAVAEKLKFLPGAAIKALQAGAALLPTKYHNFSFDFKVKSFLRGLPHALARRQQVWLGSFTPFEVRELLTPAWQHCDDDIFGPIDELAPQLQGLSTTDAVSRLLIQHYLHDDLLVKLDRSSMMASLEARTPFLDVDFAEFAMKLPNEWKQNKKILRQVMASRLDNVIVWRPKKGFGIPLGWWLKGPLHQWAQEVLNKGKLQADGILNPAVPSRLLREHKRGQADHRKKIWTLLAWQLWYDHWIARRA